MINKKLTPFRWCMLQSFPFIEATFDAIDNYGLLCKIIEYVNKNIDKTNELGIKVEELNNWFNSLDVQDEINKKLDEMAESGQLSEIISQYLNLTSIFTFNNINELLSSENLNNNSKAIVFGKENYTDGGYKTFIIKDVTDLEVDNENVYKLENNKYAILVNKSIFKNNVNYKRFRYKNTNCFIVDISKYDNYLKENKIKVGIANDNIGDNHFEAPSHFAKRKNATVCTNAGVFNDEEPFQIWGCCIIDGKVVVDNPIPVDDTGLHYLTIDENNRFSYEPLETSPSTMIANGIKYAVGGLFPIIENNQPVSHSYPWIEGTHPRQIWCERYDGTHFIFACEGRLYENIGLNFADIQSYLLSNYNDIKLAMSMDGGGSLSINVFKQKLNKSLDEDLTKEREVPYFLYIANENATNTEQKDLNKVLDVMGEEIYNLQTQLNKLNTIYSNSLNMISNILYPNIKIYGNGDFSKIQNQLSFEPNAVSIQSVDLNRENFKTIFTATHYGLYSIDGLLGLYQAELPLILDCNDTTLKSGVYKTTDNTLNCPNPWSNMLYLKLANNESVEIIELFFNNSRYSSFMMRRYNGSVWSELYTPFAVMGTTDRNLDEKVKILGNMIFDTTLNKPVWWNGTNWVDATGNVV